MQDEFRILEKRLITDDKVLLLHAEGKVWHYIVNNKLRIIIVFQVGRRQRRFPVDAVCFTRGVESFFEIHEEIWLEHIFTPFSAEEAKQPVQLFFEYCDNIGDWHVLPEKIDMDGEYFLKHRVNDSPGYQLFRRFLYVLLTIFLPLFLLDGYFVLKGYKKSPYLNKEKKGKKGILYHAHGIVKSLTGFGYSAREWKTNYFVKKYAHACKRIKHPKGVLLLSERLCEKGSNLELVRRRLREDGEELKEFIDTRPIHKLPLSKIRKAAKLSAGAKVIILEDFYPQINMVSLRKETKLLQLWHACGAFKMFGLSDLGKVENLFQDTKNHRNYSYTFVSGEHMIPFYSEAFGLSPDQVLPLGVPRTDLFFDEFYMSEARRRLYQKYPVLHGKRVVLFAPTFRGTGNKTAFYPRERFIVDSFVEQMPADTVFIIKNHPFVKEHFQYSQTYAARILDLTEEESINDLLFVTSLLITDYSSSIFEASLLNLNILFYVFDLEEYIAERDFYFDFSSFAPGVKACTFEELIREAGKILTRGNMGNQQNRDAFKKYFLNALDGHSTERITEKIKELLLED